MTTHVWMDQGGTFTDVVRLKDGRLHVEKVLSDRANLVALGAGCSSVRRGTTVATNALLERRGEPVLVLTNQGLGDMVSIGDQTRPHLFDLRAARAAPLVHSVVEVPGRIDASGTVLDPASVSLHTLKRHVAAGYRAAAVVLLHGPLVPEEELRLGSLCEAAGFSLVSLGHRVAPSQGFLARLHTTLVDAALSLLLPRAPGLYMKSDGGLAKEYSENWRGSQAVLSGPAGGVIATGALGRAAGFPQVIGLDMGGTSADICRVEGEPGRTDRIHIGGVWLRVPAVRLETIASGGGSVLSVRGGVFAVGPRSATSDPGPASYGRSGPATLTDCEVVLGRLPMFPSVCGPDRDQSLDVDAARAALQALDPGAAVEEIAAGFKVVAAESMAGATARLAATEGVDPSTHALVAAGGAGPAHACAVASRLGIQTVLVPFLAGGFSALGIGLAQRRAERVVRVIYGIGEALKKARLSLPFSGLESARLVLRYVGTQSDLEIVMPEGAEGWTGLPPAGEELFQAEHRRKLGFDRPGHAIEPIEVRVSVVSEAPKHTMDVSLSCPPVETVRAWFGAWRMVPLLSAADAEGVVGPAILMCGGSTVVVEAGWRATVGPWWVCLRAPTVQRVTMDSKFHPVHTAVFGARVMAIAEQMGVRLARLARSVSIRQRQDFSCAVFDAAGQLIANAPHVPVHLGAMGATVVDLLQRCELRPGDAWASNDPYSGGSHLPDITVVQAVFWQGNRIGFVACRGHHIDVGGIQPGSMPPASTHIEQEGFVLQQVCVASGGQFLPPALLGCRQPDDVRADLEAQVAACVLGVRNVGELVEQVGIGAFLAQLENLKAQAERAVTTVLAARSGVHRAIEIFDDGHAMSACLEIKDGRGVLHVQAPAHPGNLNAPRAIAIAVLLYVFRCLVDEPIPLNAGAIRPFSIQLEPGGLFDPVYPRAVAGGNVETSQRLVDALLRAMGVMAGSQGTMNNLTVGTPEGAWYETIGGGSGAGPVHSGAHAVQVHMTNTRATDIEVLESQFPVRIVRWAQRIGSGGSGVHQGGDGVVKEWVFLAPAAVAVLAERRAAGAPGLGRGGPGQPGLDERDIGNGWEAMPLQWQARPGDRLRISTPGGGGWSPAE